MPDLDVFIHGKLAGTITDANGSATFVYDEKYVAAQGTPLSLSTPLSLRPYEVGQWIDGLLPDNHQVREVWAARSGAASSEPINLLATDIGHDCAGAVQFVPAGTALPQRPSVSHELSEHDIATWVRQARQDWSTWGGEIIFGQFSLGGAQAKCALSREDDKWAMPHGERPTTHIIKPGLDEYDDAEVVEHVCLTAARRLGLDAAHTELAYFEDERVVVVTRFDRRQPMVGGPFQRVHQEDLCQALGIAPDRKYQSEGGPSPSQVSDLLWAESSDSHRDVRRFRDALIYNWAIAAPDAHAKNYSVLLEGRGVDLAPMYDVISYLPYLEGRPAWKLRTAMRIGKDYTLRKSDRLSAWERTASSLRLDAAECVERAENILRRVPTAISDTIDGLSAVDRASSVLPDLDRGAKRRSVGVLNELTWQQSAKPRRSPSRTSTRIRPRVMVCGAKTPTGTCGRRLVNLPCPLHPGSPGSQSVRATMSEQKSAAVREALDRERQDGSDW